MYSNRGWSFGTNPKQGMWVTSSTGGGWLEQCGSITFTRFKNGTEDRGGETFLVLGKWSKGSTWATFSGHSIWETAEPKALLLIDETDISASTEFTNLN